MRAENYALSTGGHVPVKPVDKPDVSVVMAVRDGERYLEKAARSVMSQTLMSIELIIVDDGSQDRTPEILDRFSDQRIRVVTQPPRGLAAALNRGVHLARAGLVARMDADDISLPSRLERQMRFMVENPSVGLLGTAITVIDETGQPVRNWSPALDDAAIRQTLLRANQFAHPAVMFRKAIFESVGGYANMPLSQDYDLWLRMASRCDLANLAEPLVQRRETSGQFGTSRETSQIRWAMRARWNAVRRGDYPAFAARHMVRPAVASITPGPVREAMRRFIGQRRAA